MNTPAKVTVPEAVDVLRREATDLEAQAVRLQQRAFALRQIADYMLAMKPEPGPLALMVSRVMTGVDAAKLAGRSVITSSATGQLTGALNVPLDNLTPKRVPTSRLVVAELKAFPGETLRELTDHIVDRIQSKAARRRKLVASTVDYLIRRGRVRRDRDGKLFLIGG